MWGLVILATIVDLCIGMVINLDLEVFNPMRNYKRWHKLNWFGVWAGTIFLHIAFIPFAIIYWGYYLVTIGRK